MVCLGLISFLGDSNATKAKRRQEEECSSFEETGSEISHSTQGEEDWKALINPLSTEGGCFFTPPPTVNLVPFFQGRENKFQLMMSFLIEHFNTF